MNVLICHYRGRGNSLLNKSVLHSWDLRTAVKIWGVGGKKQVKYLIFSARVIHGLSIAISSTAISSTGSLETFFSNLIWSCFDVNAYQWIPPLISQTMKYFYLTKKSRWQGRFEPQKPSKDLTWFYLLNYEVFHLAEFYWSQFHGT